MVYELPLFPLNTVLFPGMPLTLHIFEPRYKQMIEECLDGRQPFGVVLIREGRAEGGPLAEPHRVGCTADIAQVQTLEDERYNILAVGRQRFRIVTLSRNQPYLTGSVENFPLDMSGPEASRVSHRLRPWLEEYLSLLSEAGDVAFDASALPDDPQELAYLAATILQVPNDRKQDLLAATEAVTMLNDMYALFRHELPLLRMMMEQGEDDSKTVGPFSLN